MQKFIYPAKFEIADDGITVTFPNIPEAITCGDDHQDTLIEATNCLDVAISVRISENESIPTPSPPKAGQPLIAVPAQTAGKAAVYLAMKETRLKKTELAEALGVDEKEVRRILDPHYKTKIQNLERALHVLGKRLILTMDDAA